MVTKTNYKRNKTYCKNKGWSETHSLMPQHLRSSWTTKLWKRNCEQELLYLYASF